MPKKEINRASDRKYHYTYLITDTVNNKFYYGVHSTDYDPEDINQYHSSSKHLKIMIKELGICNFTKEVRRYFNNRQDADLWEHKVLRRMKVRTRDDFYNQSEGGIGYVTTGYVSVRCKTSGKNLRVPCDDPYIGIYYDHIAKGRKLPENQVKALSELYKGKWKGRDNPVYYNLDKSSWRKNVSASNVGKNLPESQIDSLKDPSHWGHLAHCPVSEDVKERMKFQQSINNKKYANVYLFKGEVYLHEQELPVRTNHCEVLVIPEPHPLVNILQAGEKCYPDIKSAAKDLGVHRNTISNRLKNTHECWKDYHFLDEDLVRAAKVESENVFRSLLYDKYKDTLAGQKNYVRPFSSGMSDEEATKLFMSKGTFLEGTTFERLKEKDSHGYYSWYQVICPLCSYDVYTETGVCSGVFKATYGCLKLGAPPCRCGDPKNYKLPIYLYHVKQLCHKEGIELIDTKTFIGKKETKLKWKCRKGNIHEKTRLGDFLEKGSRCKCCRSYYRDNPPERIKLRLLFSERLEKFKEAEKYDKQNS